MISPKTFSGTNMASPQTPSIRIETTFSNFTLCSPLSINTVTASVDMRTYSDQEISIINSVTDSNSAKKRKGDFFNSLVNLNLQKSLKKIF